MKAKTKNSKIPMFDGMPARVGKFGVLIPDAEFCMLMQNRMSRSPRGPVLSASSKLKRLRGLMGGKASFGFGRVAGPGFSILTIRHQVGPVQIYWLADASDPQIWTAIDTWRANRQVPVALLENGEAIYAVPEIDWTPGVSTSGIDEFRSECGRDMSVPFVEFCLVLTESGIIERQATSDLEGIKLSHVEVNILIPERLTQYVGAPLSMGGPPVIVLPDSPVSGELH